MEEIKNTIKNIFKTMGLAEPEAEIRIDNSVKGREIINLGISINAKDAEIFIKDNSEGLNALQHLTRMIFSRQNPGHGFLILDINSYKEGRKNELGEIALETAKKVRRSKKAVILEPMPAYERRIIHLKLAEQPDIITESIGQEPERRIMIRLYP